MLFQDDRLARAFSPRMLGNDRIAHADGDALPVILDEHVLSNGNGRYRVMATLVQDPGLGGDDPGFAFHPVVMGDGGTGDQLLQLEQVAGTLPGGLVYPTIGGLLQPDPGLHIEVVKIGKRPPVEEVILHVIDHPLDLPLGLRSVGTMGTRDKPVMVSKVDEGRVKFPRTNADLLHVVVQDAAGPSAAIIKCLLVASDQRLQVHAGRECHEHEPRIAQDQDKGVDAGQPTRTVAIAAAVTPVTLRLLPGRGLVANNQFARPAGTDLPEVILQYRGTAGIAHAPNLFQQSHSREVALLDALLQVILVGIQLAGAFAWLENRRSLRSEHLAYSVTGMTRHPGDRPNRMSLTGQEFDVHVLIWIEHRFAWGSAPRQSRCGFLAINLPTHGGCFVPLYGLHFAAFPVPL